MCPFILNHQIRQHAYNNCCQTLDKRQHGLWTMEAGEGHDTLGNVTALQITAQEEGSETAHDSPQRWRDKDWSSERLSYSVGQSTENDGTIKKKDIPKSAWDPSYISCQKLNTKSGAKYLQKCWRAYQLRPSLSQSRLRALCTTYRNFINILSIPSYFHKPSEISSLTNMLIISLNFQLYSYYINVDL